MALCLFRTHVFLGRLFRLATAEFVCAFIYFSDNNECAATSLFDSLYSIQADEYEIDGSV